jgi:hypothetical protein
LASRNISPKNEVFKSFHNNSSQLNLMMQPGLNDGVGPAKNALQSNQQIAPVTVTTTRSKTNINYLDNSHSNKKLPTWKGSLFEGSRLSQVDETAIKERSLDRVNSKKILGNALGGGANSVVQSRHELLQNNYKKVI